MTAPHVVQIIDHAVRRFGDTVAVVDGDHKLSFRQVGERSNRLANAVLSLSGEPGGRVALLLPNRLESMLPLLCYLRLSKWMIVGSIPY